MTYEYETMEDNPQRVKPNVQEVTDIVNTHTTESNWKLLEGDRVKITLYDLEDTQDVISELAKYGHSFDVDIAFEAPIDIKVDSRINPEI